jgi:hypothetical protein
MNKFSIHYNDGCGEYVFAKSEADARKLAKQSKHFSFNKGFTADGSGRKLRIVSVTCLNGLAAR